jgi:hypothetical protein
MKTEFRESLFKMFESKIAVTQYLKRWRVCLLLDVVLEAQAATSSTPKLTSKNKEWARTHESL